MSIPALALARTVFLVGLTAVAGCTLQPPRPAAAPTQKVGIVFAVGGRGDLASNDMAHAGLSRARREFGALLDTQEVEPAPGGENREDLLRAMAREGFDLVFGIGDPATDALRRVAAEFPGIWFGLVDGVIVGLRPKDNIVCLPFREEEGSFLAGAAAAAKSRTGIIGFLGGAKTPMAAASEVAYIAGARYVRPGTIILSDYVGTEAVAFNNPARGRQLALALYERGADVIYHVARHSGDGVFEAAVVKRRMAIGSGADQALSVKDDQRSRILTSVVKRVDVAVYETIKALVEGSLSGGCRSFGLAEGGVIYAENDFNKTVLADIKPMLEDLRAGIIRGRINVPRTRAELDALLRARRRQ